MGREVRMVPKDWQHPRHEIRDGYKPLFDRSYTWEAENWLTECIAWSKKQHEDYSSKYKYYWEYAGSCPEEEDYMPDWPKHERTHYQMYENTSEGTPISPVMETPEELAKWLFENKASSFAGMTLHTNNG